MITLSQLLLLTDMPNDNEMYVLTGQVVDVLRNNNKLECSDTSYLCDLLTTLGHRLRCVAEENKQERKDQRDEIDDLKGQVEQCEEDIVAHESTVEHYMAKLDMANALVAQLREDKQRMKDSYDNLNLLFKRHMGTA